LGRDRRLHGLVARPENAAGELSQWPSPRRAASIVAMSIFLIVIMASIARFAAARSGSVVASSNTRGVICQECLSV
jgi:hypothetical protein